MKQLFLSVAFLIVGQQQLVSQNSDVKKAKSDAREDFASGNYLSCIKNCDYVLYYVPNDENIKSLRDSCDYREFYIPYIRKADSLFNLKNYALAGAEYYRASKLKITKSYASMMSDSCSSLQQQRLTKISHESDVKRVIKQFKDVNAVIIFDEEGKPIGYKNSNGEFFKIENLLEGEYKSRYIHDISLVTKADWDNYR